MNCELCGEPATVDGLCASHSRSLITWEAEISDGDPWDVREVWADIPIKELRKQLRELRNGKPWSW